MRYLSSTYDVHAAHLQGTLESGKNAEVVPGCFRSLRRRYHPDLRI